MARIEILGLALAAGLAWAGCESGKILPEGEPDGAGEDASTSDLDEFAGPDWGDPGSDRADDGGDWGREEDRPDDAGADSGDSGGDSGDSGDPGPYQICIDKINQLRATKSLPAYTRWASAEDCVDGQATADEQSNSPHGSFGQCGENAQNECLYGGASGIEACLESMWAEKDQPGCSGCDACADAYNPNCPNCDFYGSETGDVCGHYVNMSAKYFHQAACGFSSAGSWAAIDFK